ncbi:MAG: class I SAM-dependent methyltransferase [Myxococcales bacterium]|nr:class I SAM-dependent methyltransferase [Myxococcales bacterium]
MFDAEQRHFWFRGSRAVVQSWLTRAISELGTDGLPSLVDVGAGTGGMLERISSQCDAWGVEYSPDGAAFCHSRGVRVLRGGLPHLPLTSDRFDLALSMDVFEHVEDDVAAMADVRRVLRPGGRLIMTVPALQWLWSEHDEALHHHRRYDKQMLETRLGEAGFRVVRCSYYNSLLLPPIALARFAGRLKDMAFPSTTAPSSDVGNVPEPFNGILTAIFSSERHLLARGRLPLGASLIAECEA